MIKHNYTRNRVQPSCLNYLYAKFGHSQYSGKDYYWIKINNQIKQMFAFSAYIQTSDWLYVLERWSCLNIER